MEIKSLYKKTIICVLFGILATMITTFVVTKDVETLAGASLLGLFMAPSIVLYFILDFFNKTQKIKTLGFLIPVVVMLALGCIEIWIDSQRASSDGSGEMTKLFAANLMVGSILLLIICQRMTKNDN